MPGTYSSEPALTSLTVTPGTLGPAFNSYGFLYSVLDVPHTNDQITLNATAKTGYTISWHPAADADPNTDGHQVGLEVGYNRIFVSVDHDQGVNSFLYEVIVKRAGSSQQQLANTPATGQPLISGKARVGEVLEVDTSGISDGDGLTNAAFTYQWLADDAEIAVATGPTYTLVEAELGEAVKVRVSFTDDGGNNETLTSVATTAVSAALPPPDNVRAVTQKSGAVELTWQSPDGAPVTGYRIERRRAGENRSNQQRSVGSPKAHHTLVEDTGSAETGYTDESAEKGVEYEYRVTARNEAGPGGASDWVRAGPASASNNPATGLPSIIGTTQVGQTLKADITGIADADGLTGATFSYQWLADDAPIDGATGSTYTLAEADAGKAIKVGVTFTDDADNVETLTSAVTEAVEASTNTPATGAPTISGTTQVGQTLKADITGIADADGLSGETFTYQWVSGDGTTDTDIEKATDSTYKLVAADQGRYVRVRVTFTDDGGNEETLTSAPTEPVLGDGLPGAPRNLTATAGNKEVTLSWEPPADNGNAPATRYRIEWRIDGKDYDKNALGHIAKYHLYDERPGQSGQWSQVLLPGKGRER